MSNETSFIQQFHAAVQIKLLNETAINSYKWTHDTFLSCIIIQMLIDLNVTCKYAYSLLITANQFKK